MRILYYSSHPNLHLDASTGYGTHMREMIAAWRNSGYQVTTFVGGVLESEKANRPSVKTSSSRNIIKAIVPNYLWQSLRDKRLMQFDNMLANRLEELINDLKPDLVYERIAYLQDSGIRVCKKLGVKHISEINAPFPEERKYFSGSSAYINRAKRIEAQLLVDSDSICVVSTALKTYLTQKSNSSPNKIRVIPNAVTPGNYQLDPKRVEELRLSFNLTGKAVIGFVGSIFPYHGVDLLIEAFANLNKPDSSLLIVGDGESIQKLKERVSELKLENQVIFTGSVPHKQVMNYIQLMDICCMVKSNWYGSPVKIFEYSLMKKAVIAPNVSPVQDVMEGGKDGLLVEDTIEDVTKSLDRLIQDVDLRNHLASNWNKKVLTHYTWEVAAVKTLEGCI